LNLEVTVIFLLTLLPIMASPGPANILYAASGSSFGVKKTIPFWLATNITSVFQTLAVGFGLNFIMQTHPEVLVFIRYLGILFLFYLAYKFFKMSVDTQSSTTPLTFKDGVIIEALNAKYLIIPSIMFSQFYNPSEGYTKIVLLSFLLLSITLISSMMWILGENTLSSFVSDEKMQKYQGMFFGSLLFYYCSLVRYKLNLSHKI